MFILSFIFIAILAQNIRQVCAADFCSESCSDEMCKAHAINLLAAQRGNTVQSGNTVVDDYELQKNVHYWADFQIGSCFLYLTIADSYKKQESWCQTVNGRLAWVSNKIMQLILILDMRLKHFLSKKQKVWIGAKYLNYSYLKGWVWYDHVHHHYENATGKLWSAGVPPDEGSDCGILSISGIEGVPLPEQFTEACFLKCDKDVIPYYTDEDVSAGKKKRKRDSFNSNIFYVCILILAGLLLIAIATIAILKVKKLRKRKCGSATLLAYGNARISMSECENNYEETNLFTSD